MSPDVRRFLIHSTRKVIDHYQHVLATHPMPEGERDAIHDRIAREDSELRRLMQRDQHHVSREEYSEAA
jgi:hypothetical protein